MPLSCDNTDKLMYQYRSSTALTEFFNTLAAEYCVLSAVLDALETRLDIGRSVGVQLDLIGEIVGVPRPLNIQIDPDDAFGFDQAAVDGPGYPTPVPPDYGWSGFTREDRGGRFVGVDGLFIGRMFDIDYRTLLRARIYTNKATGTREDLLQFLSFVLNTPASTITVVTGRVDIQLGRSASSVEVDIIRALIPVIAGVEVGDITMPGE